MNHEVPKHCFLIPFLEILKKYVLEKNCVINIEAKQKKIKEKMDKNGTFNSN